LRVQGRGVALEPPPPRRERRPRALVQPGARWLLVRPRARVDGQRRRARQLLEVRRVVVERRGRGGGDRALRRDGPAGARRGGLSSDDRLLVRIVFARLWREK